MTSEYRNVLYKAKYSMLTAQTRSYLTPNIKLSLKNPIDPKCRFYDPFNETIKHLVAGCKLFTLEKKKRNKAGEERSLLTLGNR